MEESLLGLIQQDAIRFAKVLSDTLDTDILIIDTNMNIVGSAFKYLDLYRDIHLGSLIPTVIIENRNLIVEDKNRIPGCRKCDKFRECKMSSLVGVPIRYENQVVGALALILTKHRAKFMFESLDSTVSFLENFALVLSGKIESETTTIGLQNRIKEVEGIMDKLFEAVVYTDYYGNIVHVNQRFCDVFHFEGTLIGKNMKEIFPCRTVQEYFQGQEDLSNRRFIFEQGEAVFHGVVSSKKIYLSATEFGTLFYFRPQSDFVKRINISEQGSLVTMEWMQQYLSGEELQEASKHARLKQNILIQGESIDMCLLLAKAIFNESDRNLHDLYVVYADNLYRDLFKVYMLDEYGILRNADQSTVVIMNPESMPLYIQNALADFMKTGRFTAHNQVIRSDVRFIFGTSSKLEQLVERGDFSAELYTQLAPHEIHIGEVALEGAKMRKYIGAGLDFYKKIYQKRGLEVSGEVIKYLQIHHRELGEHRVELIIERIASECRGRVTLAELEQIIGDVGQETDFVKIKQTEKQQIQKMLDAGYSKNKIVDALGFSRATLYRKIKEYGL